MLKLVLILLGLKFLIPSKEQQKKRKKAKARRKRLLWLASLVGKKKLPAKPVKKKMGMFRKIKLAVKTLVFVCISIPLIDLSIKGFKMGKKVYGLLPAKKAE